MLESLMAKLDNMQQQMGKVSKERQSRRTSQKEMLEIKITVIYIKNSFNRLISRLDIDEEKINELKDKSIKLFKL